MMPQMFQALLLRTMMGFSIIAKEAGFNFWMVMLTTATVWGMPGKLHLQAYMQLELHFF